MINRIVNFQLKRLVSQDVQGDLDTARVANPFVALHPVNNINSQFTPPRHGLTVS